MVQILWPDGRYYYYSLLLLLSFAKINQCVVIVTMIWRSISQFASTFWRGTIFATTIWRCTVHRVPMACRYLVGGNKVYVL